MPMCTLHMHFDQSKCTCFLPTSSTLNFLLILGRKLSGRNYIFYSALLPTKHPYSLLYFNCFDFWDYERKPTFVFYVETKMPLIFTIYSTYKYNFIMFQPICFEVRTHFVLFYCFPNIIST